MPKLSKLSPHDKTVQMAVGDLDHKRLQLHSSESDLTIVDVENQLLYLVGIRVETAKSGAEIDDAMMGSEIEIFTLLTLHNAGLLTSEELARGLVIADRYPDTDVAMRLGALREMVQERIELLRPHWLERRRQMAGQKILWAPNVADKTPIEVSVDSPGLPLE